MGKPILIKDKRQEVFDKANSTARGRMLIKTIEQWKDDVDKLLELQEQIQKLAKECNLSVEDTKILAHIVCDKASWSSWYKKRFMDVFSPKFKEPDYNKLAMKALIHDPMKALSDKDMYEGDYILRWYFDAVTKKKLMAILRVSEHHFDMRIRNGKLDNARPEGEEIWVNPEEYEIEAGAESKELAEAFY